ncbi:helix-turn-helix and ligand-binding sensor domain-containing protein [Hanstruepera marina]|uniref:helix-turn-helix and ligand-binding sensor domain-containing protein n=1 Tax=Hanstruepera marina TaxID=2873265 RepID=UPI001CA6C383|nr:triple tyrosine motif-containing protein [Hanstruepera marina]
MKTVSWLLFLFGFLLYGSLFSQELPPIGGFSPQDYDADNQNWDISQTSNKYIYIANNKGLLEYDGATWDFYPTPNQTVMRSVHVVGKRVYTGSYMEFGYWDKDGKGTLNYTSLSNKLDSIVEDEEFWKIINIKNWVLFQSLDRIYIYNTIDESFQVVAPKSRIVKMYQINDDVFYQVFGEGVYKIENGSSLLFIDSAQILESRIVNLFDYKDGYLVITERNGFYYYKDGDLTNWDYEIDDILNNITVYSAEILKNKTILLGTISNGLLALDHNGKFLYHINQTRGLQNNTVLTITEDIDNNIWLGLDNGVNFIKSNSPYKIYYDSSGKLGTTYTSIIYNDYIYLGTNQGLFFKKTNSNQDYIIVPETNGQVWSLIEINGELFCGHDRGTFIVNGNNEATLLPGTQGTWALKPISGNPNLIIQGTYDGLNILEKKASKWSLRNRIIGFDISSRYFELIDNKVFVSHEYKGVFKIELSPDFEEALKVEKEPSFEKGLNSSLIKYNESIFYANQDGVFNYSQLKNSFYKDSILSKLYNKTEYTTGKLVVDKTNKLWGFSEYNLAFLDFDSFGNIPELVNIPLPKKQINSMNGYENISHLFKNQYLLGTSNGYLIIDLSKLNTDYEFNISINHIEVGRLDSEMNKVALQGSSVFKNKTNNLFFSYSIPEYYKYSEKRYQYLLEGYNNNWSGWTDENTHLFENLPYGEYTFKVRGKIGNIETINTASFNFVIEKPWYLSNVFIIIYIIGGMIMLLIIHLFYRAYYKNQRKKILEQTQKDLELKELENQQQITNFKNETLTQDIENKNRELAISTMSLIKKNEFLNDIKEELKKLNPDKKLNPVIRLIDKNINNSNDWEMFEEAFNNADKDFLKKVKSKHQSLTHNDLRLCAYLRLNLSSKEIAPLLNISVRSVEVKRYRLRKKMELEHETSLTDYILEL